MTLQPFHSNNITRFKGYVYLLNHQDKEFTFFFFKYSYFNYQSINHEKTRTKTLIFRI